MIDSCSICFALLIIFNAPQGHHVTPVNKTRQGIERHCDLTTGEMNVPLNYSCSCSCTSCSSILREGEGKCRQMVGSR